MGNGRIEQGELGVQPEGEVVFGQVKGNQRYRRFLLRATAKADTGWGLLALGYNMKRLYQIKSAKQG